MRVLLSLDLSTTCTGYAKFNLDTKELISYGAIKPKVKNPKKSLGYPQLQVLKLRKLAEEILTLIDEEVEIIVIEEINRGKSRITQKILDGGHFVLLEKMSPETVNKVIYIDSDGLTGWRSARGLKLQLSAHDKERNKESKKLNKTLKRGQKKFPVINQKDLACRFVNKQYGLSLDPNIEESDGDRADAIGLGHFYIHKVLQ